MVVGFFADGKLKKIETAGGPPFTLADAPSPLGGSWSTKGVIVFAPEGGIYGLRRIPSAGGDATLATAVGGAAGGRHHRPWFLPDGEHFLFAAVKPRGGFGLRSNLLVGSLGSTASKLIGEIESAGFYAEGRLLYFLGNTLMAQSFDTKSLRATKDAVPVLEGVSTTMNNWLTPVSVSNTGLLAYQAGAGESERQLTWFDRAGKAIGAIGEPRRFRTIELSPNRKIVAAGAQGNDPNGDLWLYDVERIAPTRFTFSPAVDTEAVWSPDGRTIAFLSTRTGQDDLYREPANGSGSEELLYADDLKKFPTSWSPDGKFLLYYADGGPQGADLLLLPLVPD